MSTKRKLIIWRKGVPGGMAHPVTGKGNVSQFVHEIERDGRKWLAIPEAANPEILLNPDEVAGFMIMDEPQIEVPEGPRLVGG